MQERGLAGRISHPEAHVCVTCKIRLHVFTCSAGAVTLLSSASELELVSCWPVWLTLGVSLLPLAADDVLDSACAKTQDYRRGYNWVERKGSIVCVSLSYYPVTIKMNKSVPLQKIQP